LHDTVTLGHVFFIVKLTAISDDNPGRTQIFLIAGDPHVANPERSRLEQR
jgi:hypothetical protein